MINYLKLYGIFGKNKQIKYFKKIFDSDFKIVYDNIKKIKMMNKEVYIWYCSRKSCNSIITKTNEPFLPRGKKYQCKRCNIIHNSEDLVLANKRNLKKYLDNVECIVRKS